jgi:hypothetical protein
LDQIDQDVKEKSISRAQWVSTAIDTYLQLTGSNGGADPSKLPQEMMQLRTDNERRWKETQYLKKAEKAARSMADQLRSKISIIQEQMHQAQLELESARTNATILQNDLEHYKVQSTKKIK